MKRGEVYWYTLRPPDKRRRVLILTRTTVLAYLTGVTVAPLTTTIRGIASEVVLSPEEDGVAEDCAVNTDNLQTIQKANLGDFITELSDERMREVRAAIEFSLGFDAMV